MSRVRHHAQSQLQDAAPSTPRNGVLNPNVQLALPSKHNSCEHPFCCYFIKRIHLKICPERRRIECQEIWLGLTSVFHLQRPEWSSHTMGAPAMCNDTFTQLRDLEAEEDFSNDFQPLLCDSGVTCQVALRFKEDKLPVYLLLWKKEELWLKFLFHEFFSFQPTWSNAERGNISLGKSSSNFTAPHQAHHQVREQFAGVWSLTPSLGVHQSKVLTSVLVLGKKSSADNLWCDYFVSQGWWMLPEQGNDPAQLRVAFVGRAGLQGKKTEMGCIWNKAHVKICIITCKKMCHETKYSAVLSYQPLVNQS